MWCAAPYGEQLWQKVAQGILLRDVAPLTPGPNWRVRWHRLCHVESGAGCLQKRPGLARGTRLRGRLSLAGLTANEVAPQRGVVASP